jgi:hypothetical protein
MAMNPRLLRPRLSGDADALRYIAAVQAADQQSLESGVRKAITDFIVGCKADGIWAAIKTGCILAGARTLSGALVPLKGESPTNVNFVSGDYNRKTGLVGNASSKYLNSNRNGNADPQDSFHTAVYAQTPVGSVQVYFGSGLSATGSTNGFPNGSGGVSFRNRTNASSTITSSSSVAGLIGVSRSVAGSFSSRAGGISQTDSLASQTPVNANIFIFAVNNSGPGFYSSARLSYYSIGESLNLALLDSRMASLMTALGSAIP